MSRVIRAANDGAARLGSFIVERREAGFRPRMIDGDVAADPAPQPFAQDRMSVEEAAFAQGFAEGRRTVELELAAERDALVRLAESLEVLTPEPANALALMLVETVDRLVRDIVGSVEIDANLLLARAKAAAELVAANVAPSKLRVHPADLAHLEGAGLEVALEPDPTLARGSLLLETGDGWIEDGPAIRLERLRTELDKMVSAR